MNHSDCYKHPGKDHTNVKATRDKDTAYKFAHDQQVEYMCLSGLIIDGNDKSKVDNNTDDNNKGSDDDDELSTYPRNDKDESWKVSHGMQIELFDDLLDEPEFTEMASQTRYLVEEHSVE
ncbi:hypothetical protein BGX24_011439 [Mortierella sp. AD032]|nr:hypothetical protein BGX24_011439 [Mortierella sp. AD032]